MEYKTYIVNNETKKNVHFSWSEVIWAVVLSIPFAALLLIVHLSTEQEFTRSLFTQNSMFAGVTAGFSVLIFGKKILNHNIRIILTAIAFSVTTAAVSTFIFVIIGLFPLILSTI